LPHLKNRRSDTERAESFAAAGIAMRRCHRTATIAALFARLGRMHSEKIAAQLASRPFLPR